MSSTARLHRTSPAEQERWFPWAVVGFGTGIATWSVVLPAARGGIVTGILLALARIAGETAPLLFTAFGNLDFNVSLDKPIDALPLNIFNYATSPYENLHHLALAGAIILLAIILVLSIASRYALKNQTVE